MYFLSGFQQQKKTAFDQSTFLVAFEEISRKINNIHCIILSADNKKYSHRVDFKC